MKKILLNLISLGILFACLLTGILSTSYAELHLVVTKGVSKAVPIAIVPFKNSKNATGNDAANNTTIASVIQNDLKNSGHFKVMASQSMQQLPGSFASVNFKYWKQTGNEYMVVGNVNPLGKDQYQITFALLNIYLGDSKQAPALQNPIVISKRYIVSKTEFRSLAHRISDIIYKQITGIHGIFSTKIAYVLIQRNIQQNPKQNEASISAKYSLEVADADGFNPRPLVISDEPLMSPAWSPNGKQIAYVSLANRRASIFVVDVATGKQSLISNFPGINGAPAWSPDSKNLALVLSKSGHPKIYLYNLQTRQLKQMTFGMSIDTEPNWAKDGNSFIFTSNRGGGPQIYRYSLAGGKTQRMTFDGDYNARPFFTDNDKKIVVLHKGEDGFNIAVQDIASGALKIITRNGYDSSPSVAPNGQMVIYANNKTSQGILGIVSIDGKVQLKLPAPEGAVQEPAWSPFQKTEDRGQKTENN